MQSRVLFTLFGLFLISVTGARAGELFSADDVAALLQNDPAIRTGEDLLRRLPEDFRSAPVLMYRTQTLQEASPEAPRAILFGGGGGSGRYTSDEGHDRLFLAFNGDPKQKNFQSFELIQFRKATASFEFSKIQFYPDRRPVLIQRPPECVRCHDYPGHPNWNPYPFWPGAFPSEDGFDQSGEKELGLYRAFYNRGAREGRYQYLKLASPEGPSANNDPPTKRLANILQDISLKTVPAQIEKTRHYEQYRYLTMAALRECPDLESFLPDGLHFAKKYSDVLKETGSQEKQSYVDRVTDSYKLTGKGYAISGDDSINFSLRDIPATAGLRWVMERDGGSISPWFYSFDRKEWAMMRSLFNSLRWEISYRDYTIGGDCSALRRDSLASLTALMHSDPDPLSTGLKETTLVGDRNAAAATLSDRELTSAQGIWRTSCAKCHRGQAAPVLYFDDLAKLAAQLGKPPVGKFSTKPTLYEEWIDRLKETDDRRMPPDRELTPTQIDALTRYLDEIRSTAGR